MLHAPTAQSKTESAPPTSMPERRRELHPPAPEAVKFSGLPGAHGNQAALPMQKRAGQVALRPSQVPMLQRKCACGGAAGPTGECAECRAKRLGLQRRATDQPGLEPAPPIVHDVVRSPGQPLDSASRTFMEPRFGRDFSQVRIHTDGRAAESAQAVGALAYTVGNNVAFGAGQYAPHTSDGRRLLAHELVHVLQQGGGPFRTTIGSTPIVVQGPDGEQERDANIRSTNAMEGRPAKVAGRSIGGPVLQRQRRRSPSSGAPGPPPVPAVPTPSFVCGPDVTQQVSDVMADVQAAWNGWTREERDDACWSLQDLSCGPDAWDVVELHNNAWIYQDYRPACASEGATPPCGSSVQVGADCHFAGSVNYVIFGRMCKLCDIWPSTMRLMIWVHKLHITGLDRDYDPAVRWANAGYNDWPTAATPAGDKRNCSASCPTPYGPTAHNASARFDFHWFPTHTTETVSSSCDTALQFRRNPPEIPPLDF